MQCSQYVLICDFIWLSQPTRELSKAGFTIPQQGVKLRRRKVKLCSQNHSAWVGRMVQWVKVLAAVQSGQPGFHLGSIYNGRSEQTLTSYPLTSIDMQHPPHTQAHTTMNGSTKLNTEKRILSISHHLCSCHWCQKGPPVPNPNAGASFNPLTIPRSENCPRDSNAQ